MSVVNLDAILPVLCDIRVGFLSYDGRHHKHHQIGGDNNTDILDYSTAAVALGPVTGYVLIEHRPGYDLLSIVQCDNVSRPEANAEPGESFVYAEQQRVSYFDAGDQRHNAVTPNCMLFGANHSVSDIGDSFGPKHSALGT